MLQLRDDLILCLDPKSEQLLVRDPNSGSVFEFGEQEAFLIEALRKPYDPAELLAAFNARFGADDNVHELEEFLKILADWGLLETRPNRPGLSLSKFTPADIPAHSQSGASTEPASANHETPDAQQSPFGDAAAIQPDHRWHLFRPERLFDFLDRALSPLRGLVWLIPLLVSYSIAAVWFNRHSVMDSLAMAQLRFGLLGRLIFVAFTVNLAVHLWRGVVARHYKMPVPSFGMVLAFGLIPRFNTQIVHSSGRAKAEKLWLAATSLLVQLMLFSGGVTLWLAARPSGSLLSTVGAELAMVSAISFLLMANPLWGGDGYQLLSVWMEAPNLRQRATHSLLAVFRKQPPVIAKYSKNSWPLVVFAVASVAFPAALFLFIALGAAQRLESNFQGAGVALFLLVFIYVVRNILNARSRKAVQRRNLSAAPIQSSGVAPSLMPAGQRATRIGAGAGDAPIARPSRVRHLLVILLIAALFLPYSYETGGAVKILPIVQHEIHAEADGVIERVHYQGGEWVAQGTILAEMADHRQKRDVLATQAAIQAKERDIQRLRSTPSIESIRLAEQQLATARLQLRYSVEEADRVGKLFSKGMISMQSFDDAKKRRDLDQQSIEEKRASLEALKTQINPNEIASAEAELQKLREDLVFYQEQLRRTRLSMPIAGRVATTKLQDLRNKYLEEGQLFCTVEDTREVRVEIAVPEAEIHQVAIGDPVRLKTWAEPGRIFPGVVTEIAPQATEETYGNVVMVMAHLSNADLALKTGMTGYAKIRGDDTRLGVAFTKALVRFFLIEVWSWLP